MAKRKKLRVSIVIPLFNEGESIQTLYNWILKSMAPFENRFEIIFVDDGSFDETFTRLQELHQRDQRVKVIRFRKNYGQTAAMVAGFRASRGEIVVSMDGDLQNDPEDIPRLLSKITEGFDVVCGWRKNRKDKLFSRKIPSMVANWMIGKITGVPIHDNGCSLKAFKAEVIKKVALYSELHRFIPALTTLAGARITEMVVSHHPRKFGKSKYGISRTWRVFLDLFLVKMLTKFSSHPALWFGFLCLPALFLGILSLFGMVFFNLSGIVLPTVIFLFFSLAGSFIFLGILGEMLLKTGDFRADKMLS